MAHAASGDKGQNGNGDNRMNDAHAAPNGELNDKIVDMLKTVFDPEIPVDIYELGLIYKINIDDEANVNIEMTLTSPACPVGGS